MAAVTVAADTGGSLVVEQPRARAVWPAQVREMMRRFTAASAAAAPPPTEDGDRRRRDRQNYFTEASLLLTIGGQRHTLYLRDVAFLPDGGRWVAGFIADGPLAVDAAGDAEIQGLAPAPVPVGCHLRRCREFAPGWCEGMVEFDFGRRAA